MNSFTKLPSSNLFRQIISSGTMSSPLIRTYTPSNGVYNVMIRNYWRRSRLDLFSCYYQQRPYQSCGLLHNEMKYNHKIALSSHRGTADGRGTLSFIESPWLQININKRYSSTMPHHNAGNKTGDEVVDKQVEKKGESKVRMLFRKYGYVFIGTYISVYVLTLVTFFFGLDSGLLDPGTLAKIFKVSKNLACETADVIGPTGTGASMNEAANAYEAECAAEVKEDGRTLVDIVKSYLQKWDWSKRYAQKLEENPHLANLGVAWFIVKFTEPIRLAAAVIITPKVAKLVGRKVPKI